MGMKPPWKGTSLDWRSLSTSVVYFGGFPVILASSPSPDISRCAPPISVIWQDEAVGAVADQLCRQRSVQWEPAEDPLLLSQGRVSSGPTRSIIYS